MKQMNYPTDGIREKKKSCWKRLTAQNIFDFLRRGKLCGRPLYRMRFSLGKKR